MRLDSKFENALDNLLIEIGNDYDSWSGIEPPRDMDELTLKIKTESSHRFKNELRITAGRKFMKVIHGTSVWGFVAINDGVLKGIPYKKGDTFKPAGWRGPAKHVRGSIFDGLTNWYSWTGPNYL
jgi:hypothetical protein